MFSCRERVIAFLLDIPRTRTTETAQATRTPSSEEAPRWTWNADRPMAATLLHADILNEKRRRLDQLELRAARAGINTQPEVLTEIQDLQRELAAAAPATVAESHDILYDAIQLLHTRIDGLYTRIDRLYWFMLALAAVIILAVKL